MKSKNGKAAWKRRGTMHTWSRGIDCAQPDGRLRTCRACGAQCRRHRIRLNVGLPLLEEQAALTNVPEYSTAQSKLFSFQFWTYRQGKGWKWRRCWEMPPCPGSP